MTVGKFDERVLSGVWANAHAKINLFLHITGRRADGYHFLQSVFTFVELHDRLFARPSDELTLSVAGPLGKALEDAGGGGDDDLVIKAALALQDWACKHNRAAAGAQFELEKNIPVAAGLGGGSADAAAALRAMKTLWKLPVTDEDLSRISASLGADVPACLSARTQWVEGVGELCTPLNGHRPIFCLLVNCGTVVDTGAIFQRYAGSNAAFTPLLDRGTVSDVLDIGWLRRSTKNDLATVAIARYPHIQKGLECLGNLDGCLLARMSGSGPTCFGLFDSMKAAQDGRDAFASRFPDWWAWSGRIKVDRNTA